MIKHEELKRIPVRNICGVYYLFKNNKLVYIGKSKDIEGRIQEHRADKIFDCYSFIECTLKDLGEFERNAIKHYKPELNVTYNPEKFKVKNPAVLETDGFRTTFKSYPVMSAFFHNKYFVAKLSDDEFVFSRIKSWKNRRGTSTNLKFADMRGEITGNGSTMLHVCKGWFKTKRKTYYFRPNEHKYFTLEMI